MLNNGSFHRQTSAFNMSKFWAFRLINIVSFLSIFLILSILVLPIPYLHKERKPTIIDLNINLNVYSHAIKITTRKLPGKIISVSFTTHNSDHIIGSTYFADIKLERDSEYITRFVNCHYMNKRKGLPFKILVVDVHPGVFIFRKFLLQDNQEPTYKQIEGSVYIIPQENNPLEVLNLSFNDLHENLPKNIYKVDYEDIDEKIVTQYYPDNSHQLGTITLGNTKVDLPENATYRTITTIYIKSLNVAKVILTTFYTNNSEPSYKEFYFSYDYMDHFYESPESLSRSLDINVTYDNFEINRYENKNTETIYFDGRSEKNEGLLNFFFKHEKHKYEIVVADKKGAILGVRNTNNNQDSAKSEELPLDRVLVIEYNMKEPKPPNYYIWDRMLYFNRLTIFTVSL